MRISSAFSSPVNARGRHSRADLDALDGVDRHHGAGEILIELGVERRSPAGRDAFGNDLDHGADRRPGLTHLVEVTGPEFGGCRIRREERIVFDLVPIPVRSIDVMRADLDERAANCNPRNDLARHGAGRDP